MRIAPFYICQSGLVFNPAAAKPQGRALLYQVPLMRNEAEGRVLVDLEGGAGPANPPGVKGPLLAPTCGAEWVSPLGFCPSPELGSA